MATLKDVARLSGVTVTTISRMLNNRVNVSEKTRAKILAAMEELDYHPNELAQSLIRQKSSFIGLIVPSAKNFFFGAVIDCVERYVCASGYKLLLCVSDLDVNKEVEYFHMLKSNKVAGVILASHTQNLPEHVNLSNLPLVTIDRTLADSVPSACADNYAGGRLAAEHLLDGCRHLAYISGSAGIEMDANKRWVGFCDVCRERGAEPPVMVDASERDFIAMRYEPLIHQLFQEHPEVDGVFSSNDIIASGGAILQPAGHRCSRPDEGGGLRRPRSRLPAPPAPDHHPPAGGGHLPLGSGADRGRRKRRGTGSKGVPGAADPSPEQLSRLLLPPPS